MDHVTGLIMAAHQGDKQARDTLIEENMGLIWSIVRRFSGRGYELEDLFQIGSVGLIKAVDKFDVSFDVKFSTYAVPLIQGEIKRFLRDDGMVKVSRTLKENGWKVYRAKESLSQSLGRDATLSELAAATQLSSEEIVMAMEANVEVESLHKTIYQGDGGEILLEDKLPEVEDANEKLLNHMLLEQLLASLNEEEKHLIQMRYFEDKTQTEIASELGISQVQVSRLEKRILNRMRRQSES